MQKQTTRSVIERLLQSMAARQLDVLLPLFAQQLDWDIPGDPLKAPWLWKRNTREEVGEFFRLLWKNTEAVSARVDTILVEGDEAVVVGEFESRMLATQKNVASFFCIQLRLEQGLIRRYRLFENTYAVSEVLTK